jgi:hypothetical protein
MNHERNVGTGQIRDVAIPAGNIQLKGELKVPVNVAGIVLFVQGSGREQPQMVSVMPVKPAGVV